MSRRRTRNITGIRGTGSMNASQVWRVFGCGEPSCNAILQLDEDTLADQGPHTTVTCPVCNHVNNIGVINKGTRWKYCRICEQLQPLENFHRHRPSGSSFRSGRQLECKLCKNLVINPALNPLRTSDQHREAAEGRRLYGLIAADRNARKSDERAVHERFSGRCFNCGVDLEIGQGHLDHTLPARYLWPLFPGATLLCSTCNLAKAEQWPSEFYRLDAATVDNEKLRRLSYLTGIGYDLLEGPRRVNPDALERLLADVDGVFARWIRYPRLLQRLHRDVLALSGEDLRDYAAGDLGFLDNQSDRVTDELS